MDKKLILIIGMLVLITACSNTVTKETETNTNPNDNVPKPQKSLAEMFDMKRSLTYSVDWKLTTMQDGETSETTFTQYYSGDKFRLDMTKEGVTGYLYYGNNTMYTCFLAENNIWTCKKLNYETSIYENIEKDIAENGTEYVVENIAARTILGETTSCYKVMSEGSVEYCFNDQGILLFIEAEQNNTITRFEALSYNTNIPDEAVRSPIEV